MSSHTKRSSEAFRELKERIQEALFSQSLEFRVDRSWMGRRLLVALLFTYKDLGRPGPLWPQIQAYIADMDDENISFQFGYLQLEFGMIDESIAAFRMLLDRAILREAGVDPMLVSNLIDAFNTAERYSAAIDVFENIVPQIGISGAVDRIHFNAGNSYYAVDRFAEAARCYQTALKIRTSNTCRILHNLGNCYSALGDERGAIEYYKSALRQAATDAEKGMEEYAIGNASAELGNHEEAKVYYIRAAERGHVKAGEKLAEMS